MTDLTLDQQIARAAMAYTRAQRSADPALIASAKVELDRLVALRDG